MKKNDYFEWYFICLRTLGFGRFTKPTDDRRIQKNGIETFQTSNFNLVYLARSTFPLFFLVAVPTLEVWELFNIIEKKDELLKSLMFTAVHLVMMAKFLMYFWKGDNMKLIAFLIEVETKKYFQDYKLINKTTHMTRKMLIACYFSVFLTVAMACLSANFDMRDSNTLFDELTNITLTKNYTLPFKLKMPFPVDDDFQYFIAFFLQALGVTLYGLMFFAADGYIFASTMQLVTQLIILKHSLSSLDLYALKKLAYHEPLKKIEQIYSENSDAWYRQLGVRLADLQHQVEKDLIQNIEHHQLIIRCAKLIEDTYTVGFFAHLFSGLLSLALGMSALVAEGVTNEEKAMILYYLFAMLLEQGFLCWAGNELTFQSGEIATAVMSSRWYLYSTKWRKSACLMTIRAQRPLVLTAGKFVNLSYSSFSNTIKAAYSYYTVLTRT